METLTHRQAMRLIGIGIGTAIAHAITPASLLAQTRDRLPIGTAGKGGVFSTVIARVVALPYYLKRDYGRALDVLRQADEVGPAFTQTWEVGAYIQSRSYEETLAELEKARR